MRVILDRFEGEFAVLELDVGEVVSVPKILVGSATEGDVLNISIDKEETRNRKNRIEKLMNDVFKD